MTIETGNIEVFHVSPKENLTSILNKGVLPQLSRGREKVSWWVTREKMAWALAHVSARHSVAVDSLDVFPAFVNVEMLMKTAWEGVYRVRYTIKPEHGTAAASYLE